MEILSRKSNTLNSIYMIQICNQLTICSKCIDNINVPADY